jgi:hypothetical protein
MYFDSPEELVAATLRDRFLDKRSIETNCSVVQVQDQIKQKMCTGSCESMKLPTVSSGYLRYGMMPMIYNSHSRATDVIMKTVANHDDNFLIKCRQCGDMIKASLDAIEEHSAVCLAVHCRLCGQMVSGDMQDIEAHSRLCCPLQEIPCMQKCHDAPSNHCEDMLLQHPLWSPGEDDAVARALFDVSGANLACLSQSMQEDSSGKPHAALDIVEQACQRDSDFLMQLRLEVQSQMEALRAQQMATASQSPVQIIAENCATASAQQLQTHERTPHSTQLRTGDMWWCDFLASPMNRAVIFATVQLSLYFAHGYLHHRYRMAELQQRIDANTFLRFQQILSHHIRGLL